ncbi:MAG: T9SS type A sorting domain-containing protein [Bacteroidales bacterium]|nr:T9SS type A sorting domain-containing protein [Bacteroidales bacterium]
MKKFTVIIKSSFLLILVITAFSVGAQTGYYLDRFGQGGVTMTNNSPATGIITNTTVATNSSTSYLVSWDSYYNKWSNTTTPSNSVFTLTWADNYNRPDGVLTTATTVGKYYTLQIRGLAYSDRQAVYMETDNTPQSFHATASTAVSTPAVVSLQAATINITLAGNKSPQEKVFVRYTKDNWSTTKVVEAIGVGSTWSTASATIPATENTSGATVRYYAYTTTVSATNISDHDLITLKFGNNGGTNYSYFVAAPVTSTTIGGLWDATSTWVGGVVPTSGQAVVIAGPVTLNQDATVGSLTINASKTFTASSGGGQTLTIVSGGSLINSGASAYFVSGSTGIISFAGNGTITGPFSFNQIKIAGGVSFSSTSSIKGIFTINSGGSVLTNSPTYISSSTLKYATENSESDPFPRNLEWGTTTGKIPYAIEIITNTYVNLGANGTTSAFSCLGSMTIESGSGLLMNFAANDLTQPLTIGGDLSNNGKLSLSDEPEGGLIILGNMIASGTFNHNGRSVSFSGVGGVTFSEPQIISCSATTFQDLIINNPFGVIISTPQLINVSNDLTINSGMLLTISSSSSLTVNGSIVNNAGETGLVINSDETGSGSLITSTAAPATVQRFLTSYVTVPDKMFHFLSSPVAAQTIQPEFVAYPILPNTYTDFYSFDEIENMWINTKAEGEIWNDAFEDFFEIGKGYLVAYPPGVDPDPINTTKNFIGTLNTYPSGIVKTCTYTDGKGNGWNLLGNPFPSAMDWNYITTNGLGDGMDNALYYYDNATQNYFYYIQLPGETSSSVGSGQRYIPAMQGFMVHAKTTGTKEVTINNDSRTHLGQSVYYKSADAASNIISLKVSANGYEDEAFIHFNEGATTAFDGEYDAFKLKSYSVKVPELYTISSDGSELAINGLPETASKSSIPVYFRTSLDGDYLLSVNLQNLTNDIVFITDNKLNQVQDLSLNHEYSFNATTTDEPNRFTLSFGTLGLDKPTQSKLDMYTTAGKININGVEGKADVIVRNMMGQAVQRNTLSGSTLQSIDSGKLPSGVYVVSVVSGKQTVSGKVVVK